MNGLYLLPNKEEEVIDSYDEDIIVTNREGKIIKATQISGQYYGLHAADLLGRSVYDLEAEGIFSPAITPFVLKQKKKVVLVQKAADERKVLITGIPLFNDQNEVEYVLSYSYEVSELFLLQDYLSELEGEMSKVKEELVMLREKSLTIEGMIAESKSMKQVLETVANIAPHPVSVLIHGENGVGKSSIAKLIHKKSAFKDGPFIEVNCAAIPDALFEYEFLGSADNDLQAKTGLLRMARGGTLYLQGADEISLTAQTALVNALHKHHGDFRIISSTESNLEELVANKQFREDLYYLLHVIPLHLRPLRERMEDLSAVIYKYMDKFRALYSTEKQLSDDLFHDLLHMEWPGNHLEVKNLIERLIVQSGSSVTITTDDLPAEYRRSHEKDLGQVSLEGRTLPDILERVEKQVLISTQKRCKTTTEMANVLGISQPSIVRKLKKYSI